jgi:hypothetical protein
MRHGVPGLIITGLVLACCIAHATIEGVAMAIWNRLIGRAFAARRREPTREEDEV